MTIFGLETDHVLILMLVFLLMGRRSSKEEIAPKTWKRRRRTIKQARRKRFHIPARCYAERGYATV